MACTTAMREQMSNIALVRQKFIYQTEFVGLQSRINSLLEPYKEKTGYVAGEVKL